MTYDALRLRPATPAEFDDWLPAQLAGYAEYIAASGAMSPDDAREKARRDTERTFSSGLNTPGQLVFRVLAEAEVRARGMTAIGLNVHGQNMIARSLYDSLGYAVTAQQMKKPLG